MATNAINDGDTVDIELEQDVDSGEFFLHNDQVVVAAVDGEIGDTITVARKGRFRDAPKESGTDRDWSALQNLYWDEAEDRFTDDDDGGSNDRVAKAAADADEGDDTGEVILTPDAS